MVIQGPHGTKDLSSRGETLCTVSDDKSHPHQQPGVTEGLFQSAIVYSLEGHSFTWKYHVASRRVWVALKKNATNLNRSCWRFMKYSSRVTSHL